MTAREIEVAVAKYFDYRRNLIVPNVSWGLGFNHEADLLILSGAGYASEVEIKITKADLIRDRLKAHKHESDLVKALWFAVPETLGDFAIASIPSDAGLLVVSESKKHHGVNIAKPKRVPKLRQHSRKFTETERYQLSRLGLMRYWGLRHDFFDGVERIAI